MKDDLIMIDGYFRGPVKKWESDLYGYELASGYGDLITNHMKLIIETHDRSDWAYEMLEECFDLLLRHKRWPDSIQDQIPKDRQCKNRLCSWLNKMKFKAAKRLDIDVQVKYRSQGDLTRDIYISAITCAIDMDILDFIHTVSIPWYLYRPKTWAWHRYLKNPTERNLNRYDYWAAQPTSKKEFVIVLNQLMEYAVRNLPI